ncbi:tautomerase family protein [Azospirillum sp. ST 5-10]|uniref:tautomerase family protein n=1 Tax=unclassified Azospirillum TaxID=2630922 RepID=UPI003F49F917
MPIITVSLTATADPALSARIAETVTGLTQRHLRKDPAVTAVAIHYLDPAHWFAGGRSLAEQGTATVWLDIKVVDGTNTKTELADYLAAVFAAFDRLLGGIHPESYVLVHEVPAAAYGYGGKTQEFRFVSGRMERNAA